MDAQMDARPILVPKPVFGTTTVAVHEGETIRQVLERSEDARKAAGIDVAALDTFRVWKKDADGIARMAAAHDRVEAGSSYEFSLEFEVA